MVRPSTRCSAADARAGSSSWLVLAALGSMLGCGGDPEPISPPGGTDAGATDADPTLSDAGESRADVGGSEPDAGMPPDPFGLSERPRNPTCVAPPRPPSPAAAIRLERVFIEAGLFDKPLGLYPLPGAPGTFWVIEQSGRIRSIRAGEDDAPIADLTGRVEDSASETGLLGLAFHPRFADNGRVFLAYTALTSRGLVSRLSELSSPNRTDLDPASERVVHEVRQPAANHNGGAIAFGPDGHLYYALGDGGRGNDVFGNGQNRDTVLGAILRLDVDGAEPYAIPPDNPFAEGGGAPEIYAWGFRNPWRMSFDRGTGELWAADVGQNAIEEVDQVFLGGNYGWNVKEGTRCFSPRTDCDDAGLVEPVVEYTHAEGSSITGGYVYRGSAIPSLVAAYVYGDFVSGRMWAARGDPNTGGWRAERLLDAAQPIASFAEDADGELYLLAYNGRIFRLVADGDPPTSELPARLSETGCVLPGDPRRPASGLIPYAPNAPLWSDGADKERYVALPDGATVEVAPDGDLVFPPGTVTLKHFRLGPTYVETRLFVRHEDGGWAGYSYAWNPEQTDATLVEAGLRVRWGDQDWIHPSRAQCMACHTEAAGRTLGLELGQLDGLLAYPSTGRVANQLATWRHIGLLPEDAPTAPRLPPYAEDSAPVEARAKAWLHTNCSVCHRPDGPGRGDMDLRFQTALADQGICDELPIHGELGLEEARIFAPGAAERSVLLERSLRLDVSRMPPLASERIDAVGTGLLAGWIREVASCP